MLTREDLGTSNGSVHFKETIATAKRRGELNGTVSTECEATMRTAVEGKVSLSAAERTGDPFIFYGTTKDALKFDFVVGLTGMSALKLQPPSPTTTGLNSTASSSSTGLQAPAPSPRPRERSKNSLIEFGRGIFGYE